MPLTMLITSDSQNYVHDYMAQCMFEGIFFSVYSITTIFPAFQYIFYIQVRLLFQMGPNQTLQLHIREFIAPPPIIQKCD